VQTVTDTDGVRRQRGGPKTLSSQIERISGRIEKVKASDYPIWVLEERLAAIEADRLQILKQLEAIEASVLQALAQGNVDAIEAHQLEARKLKRKKPDPRGRVSKTV
jgi:ABC-type transport system involved in cytochrome c biogenesis ATPase subunit